MTANIRNSSRRQSDEETRMSLKKTLIFGVSLTALMMAVAPAKAANECGSINTASNPQTVTCTGAFNPYASGITYDESTVPSVNQGNLQVKLAATGAVVSSATAINAKAARTLISTCRR